MRAFLSEARNHIIGGLAVAVFIVIFGWLILTRLRMIAASVGVAAPVPVLRQRTPGALGGRGGEWRYPTYRPMKVGLFGALLLVGALGLGETRISRLARLKADCGQALMTQLSESVDCCQRGDDWPVASETARLRGSVSPTSVGHTRSG